VVTPRVVNVSLCAYYTTCKKQCQYKVKSGFIQATFLFCVLLTQYIDYCFARFDEKNTSRTSVLFGEHTRSGLFTKKTRSIAQYFAVKNQLD